MFVGYFVVWHSGSYPFHIPCPQPVVATNIQVDVPVARTGTGRHFSLLVNLFSRW